MVPAQPKICIQDVMRHAAMFSPAALCPRSVFDRFRAIAHEGEVDKRVQFTIEELYRVRARGFEAEGFAAVMPALDLVRRHAASAALECAAT